jgi:hypothetical protein
VDEARRREVLRELSANTGMDFGDLGDDLVAASAAVVQAGGPGALETAPVDTGPAPDPAQDMPAFIRWAEATLNQLTQPRQRQPEGLAADGMPVDAGGGPPGAAARREAAKARARAEAPAPRVAENGVVMPPPPPEGMVRGDQGLAPQSPYRKYPLGPR